MFFFAKNFLDSKKTFLEMNTFKIFERIHFKMPQKKNQIQTYHFIM